MRRRTRATPAKRAGAWRGATRPSRARHGDANDAAPGGHLAPRPARVARRGGGVGPRGAGASRRSRARAFFARRGGSRARRLLQRRLRLEPSAPLRLGGPPRLARRRLEASLVVRDARANLRLDGVALLLRFARGVPERLHRVRLDAAPARRARPRASVRALGGVLRREPRLALHLELHLVRLAFLPGAASNASSALTRARAPPPSSSRAARERRTSRWNAPRTERKRRSANLRACECAAR